MAKLKSRKRAILIKLEAAYGVDAGPDAQTDALRLRDLSVTPLAIRYDERTLVRHYLGAFGQVVGMGSVTVELEVELVAAGPARPVAPPAAYDALLQAVGLAVSAPATTQRVYTPASDGHASATLYYAKDGVLQKITGARGSATLHLEVGKIPSLRCTLTGLWGGVVDAPIGAPNVSAYQTPQAVNANNTGGLMIHGYAGALLRSLSLDLGHTVTATSYAGDAEAVDITARAVTGKLSVAASRVADCDWLGRVAVAVTGPLAIEHGPPGNRLRLDAPAVQLRNPAEAEDKGLAFFDFDLAVLPQAGDDELTLENRDDLTLNQHILAA